MHEEDNALTRAIRAGDEAVINRMAHSIEMLNETLEEKMKKWSCATFKAYGIHDQCPHAIHFWQTPEFKERNKKNAANRARVAEQADAVGLNPADQK